MLKNNETLYKTYGKDFLDIFLSLLGLILLSPLLLIISLLIKVDSEGPVFFKQKRLGKYGREFKIYKFRTMVVNAENIGDGLSIKTEKDNRITKVGGFLRKTSFDELPQLINVLRSEMALIGPRPPVTYHPYNGYGNYPNWAKKRFNVKPGITGLAQVRVRNSATWDERIELDNMYVNNMSLVYDIKIFLDTIMVVFRKDKIY